MLNIFKTFSVPKKMNSNADDIPMNSISDDMLKEFRTAFNMLDSNNDGKLSVLDTISLLR